MRYAVGVDLGGTHIKAASVSEMGEVLGRASGSTRDHPDGAAGAWVPTIRALVSRLAAERGAPPSGFGVGAPGIAAADEIGKAHV